MIIKIKIIIQFVHYLNMYFIYLCNSVCFMFLSFLGLFEPSHMLYTLERSPVPNEPTLAQMTEKAIKILSRGSNGYFLLVEGNETSLDMLFVYTVDL